VAYFLGHPVHTQKGIFMAPMKATISKRQIRVISMGNAWERRSHC